MKRLLLLLLGAGLLLACRKDDLLFVNSPTDALTTLQEVLQRNAPPKQVFSFALNQPQTLRTAAGATISFPANAFRLPDGHTLATGQAELRVREIYSVPDMLLADMPTTAALSGQLLVSGGEFTIQVWQGSTRLRLVPSSAATGIPPKLTLTSPVPGTGVGTAPMQLWQLPMVTGINASQDSSGWQLQRDPSGNAIPVPTASGYYTAAISLDSLSNWNIDQLWHLYQNSGSGYLGIEVPTGPSATITRVYVRPVAVNGLARCNPLSVSSTRWNSLMPYGTDVVAVVLQERNGQLYYGTQRLTTAANAVVSPTLQALTAAEIIQRIRQL
jgi:hypothetical protein